MVEYHKIDTVYERDTNGTKKLIEGQYRDKTVEYLANNDWLFTEKIDGTNIRVGWDGHTFEFAGRTDKASIPTHLLETLNFTFMSDEMEQMFEQLFGDKQVILFGEGYGAKIQNGGNYRSDVGFILFDVMIDGYYLARDSVEEIAKTLGLEIVPIILKGTIKEAVHFVKNKPMSTIGKAAMEGLVGKPVVDVLDRRGKRVVVKIKVKDFV